MTHVPHLTMRTATTQWLNWQGTERFCHEPHATALPRRLDTAMYAMPQNVPLSMRLSGRMNTAVALISAADQLQVPEVQSNTSQQVTVLPHNNHLDSVCKRTRHVPLEQHVHQHSACGTEEAAQPHTRSCALQQQSTCICHAP
jgi:hypothetical protein